MQKVECVNRAGRAGVPEGRQMNTVSRRSVLRAAATLTLAGLASAPARAIGRLAGGGAEFTVIADGFIKLPLAAAMPEVPRAELETLLAADGLATDALVNDCNVTVLRKGGRLVVFDAGAGPNFLPTTGRLADNLAEAGIDPAEVTDVVFTHAHPDHIWGVTDDFDELLFPNADYRISQAEWDFWLSQGALDAMPAERKNFVPGARNRFKAIEARVSFFKPGEEVIEGVEAVGTPGHTPGHTSFMVHGGEAPVLILGDAATNLAVSLERPDWPTGADQDPDLAIRTRVTLLDRLAGDKARVIGFHFPHPGAGVIERKGRAYRFTPV
jgi:glyoxylase-like metal-dependent hydrolase (beta-lactamase superfamily II)